MEQFHEEDLRWNRNKFEQRKNLYSKLKHKRRSSGRGGFPIGPQWWNVGSGAVEKSFEADVPGVQAVASRSA